MGVVADKYASPSPSYSGYRFLAEIIHHTYLRFTLSYRDIEKLVRHLAGGSGRGRVQPAEAVLIAAAVNSVTKPIRLLVPP